MSNHPSPRWLRVSDHDDFPAEPDSPRVDLNRCRLWIREKITRQGHYAGETCLYENAGGRWFVFSVHVEDFTRETSEHGWWARRSEVVEWFLRHPDVEPPTELRAELDRFDATEAPAASEPKREAPLSSPTPAPAASKGRRERKYKWGELDAAARAELTKNPSLTNAQIAAILGCDESTLRNHRRCPKLAEARAMLAESREDYRGGDTYHDRRNRN